MTLDLEPIKAREQAATGGPWHWAGNTDNRDLYLATWLPGYGRCTIMDTVRWGMHGARLRFFTDLWAVNADERAVFEVARNQDLPDDTPRTHPKVYRGDVVDIRHPDAEFIVHARQDVADLIAEVERLRAGRAR